MKIINVVLDNKNTREIWQGGVDARKVTEVNANKGYVRYAIVRGTWGEFKEKGIPSKFLTFKKLDDIVELRVQPATNRRVGMNTPFTEMIKYLDFYRIA